MKYCVFPCDGLKTDKVSVERIRIESRIERKFWIDLGPIEETPKLKVDKYGNKL